MNQKLIKNIIEVAFGNFKLPITLQNSFICLKLLKYVSHDRFYRHQLRIKKKGSFAQLYPADWSFDVEIGSWEALSDSDVDSSAGASVAPLRC